MCAPPPPTYSHYIFEFFIEHRQRGRFAGFSLYVSNTGNIAGSTLCYKDGPNLPPLNFSTVCIEQGRYVIFYNERLDGAIYPDRYELQNVNIEMCEVIIQGKLFSMIFFNKMTQIFKNKNNIDFNSSMDNFLTKYKETSC